MRNNLNLIVLLGIAFTGVGVFGFGGFIEVVQRHIRLYDEVKINAEFYVFLGIGLAFTLMGGGMMFRQKWVRTPATLLLITIAGLWTILIADSVSSGRGGDPIIISITATIAMFGIVLFLILFINHDYVLEQLGISKEEEQRNRDILDQD